MTDQTRGPSVDRRTVLSGVGSLALAGLVAGCTTSTDGGNGGGGGGGTPTGGGGGGASFDKGAVDEYLKKTSNYDGSVADKTGSSTVTVQVGVKGNGGNFAFGPPAIKVDSGTTVKYEWTGKGGQHNVVEEGGGYESDLYSSAGVHFEHTFDSTGVSKYYCKPHKPLNMKGVVVVV